MEYPKIETLYDRDEKTFKVIPARVRLPEFRIINIWQVTEKVDGTNIRVMWNYAEKKVSFGGRTDSAQMPVSLSEYLRTTFTPELFSEFTEDAILFGEGYGEKIQKGGGSYRKGVSFRLFDVLVGRWWLEEDSIFDIAEKMGITTVPYLCLIDTLPRTKEDLYNIVGHHSLVSTEDGGAGCEPEGIVARSHPLLFNRKGERVMWKLKFKDF